ncbi:MAG TPA: YtxH domain-containing protein [Bryobacteraceae bacterium]|nr:YtxH domain-containing protein [Bryobacteraceae bacterium]
MKTSERILWVMVGAAVGAGIALLYAPKTGRDTRRYLRRRAEDAREAIAETGEQIRDRVVDTGETILDAGRDAYRKASSAVEGAANIFEAGRRKVKI